MNKKGSMVKAEELAQGTNNSLTIIGELDRHTYGEDLDLSSIVVRECQNKHEYERVLAFVSEQYKKHGYITRFSNEPTFLFTAVNPNLPKNHRVIGSIGLETHREGNGPFPTEDLFAFPIRTELGISRDRIAEICRLASIGKEVTLALIVYLWNFMKVRGYSHGLCCMKPFLIRYFKFEVGIPMYEYPQYHVDIGKVPEEYRGYFLKDPKPHPVIFAINDLDQIMHKIQATIGLSLTAEFKKIELYSRR